jgi:hypothetical protein
VLSCPLHRRVLWIRVVDTRIPSTLRPRYPLGSWQESASTSAPESGGSSVCSKYPSSSASDRISFLDRDTNHFWEYLHLSLHFDSRRLVLIRYTMAPEQQRPPRILACVLCQQRKKKCDRKSPCSFCIKVSLHDTFISRELMTVGENRMYSEYTCS